MLDSYVPVPGDKQCLKCRKIFSSKDVKKNWLCPSCTVKNLSIRGTNVGNPHPTGRRASHLGSTG